MPSIQCDNGKWKWGENGSCIYDSKKESDDANSDYRAISDIDFTPTVFQGRFINIMFPKEEEDFPQRPTKKKQRIFP